MTPLMRLQNPDYTKILITTLAESTPVAEAAKLQDDLRRAGINPYAWVINQSLALSKTRDPLLLQRS
jgi:arsenite-transporting ATPase